MITTNFHPSPIAISLVRALIEAVEGDSYRTQCAIEQALLTYIARMEYENSSNTRIDQSNISKNEAFDQAGIASEKDDSTQTKSSLTWDEMLRIAANKAYPPTQKVIVPNNESI